MNSDENLLRQMNRNPNTTIEKVMNIYAGLVYTIVHSKLNSLGTKEDIEECVNEIFFYFYENHNKIDLKKGSIKAFLAVLAKRKAIDIYRKISVRPNNYNSIDDYEIKDEYNIEREIIKKEDKKILINTINELGEPDNEIFIRKYFLGQSSKEISSDLKLKENTINKKVSRGLKKLQEVLGGVL